MTEVDNLILGGGIAGLAASYHLGHAKSLILEGKPHPYGHIFSEVREGFTWDEGPHVSFTKSEYVKNLFEESVGGGFKEYQVQTGNYYQGHWIGHPAQSNLHQIPEPLRSNCLQSFLKERKNSTETKIQERDYGSWLMRAFGEVFATTFPSAYTRKYWTVEPWELGTDWIGPRVFFPSVDDVVAGAKGPLDRQTHYIQKVRYPTRGGYKSFAETLAKDANIRKSRRAVEVDLGRKTVRDENGEMYSYRRLVSTIPLATFLQICRNVPAEVKHACQCLSCTELLLVNVGVNHPSKRKEDWIYVYDEDKYSTRINFIEKLSERNAPPCCSGIQMEVNASKYKPSPESDEAIADKVIREIEEMGLIDSSAEVRTLHAQRVPWANVIFTKDTKPALDKILDWLSIFGLSRESDDTHPLTDWSSKSPQPAGDLNLAGRYAQWKYYWTDDCVLRSYSWNDLY